MGAEDLTGCLPCPAGKYCESLGATEYTGVCDQGYYCPGDDEIATARPTTHICPAGYFCPNDTATPQPCPPGTIIALMTI